MPEKSPELLSAASLAQYHEDGYLVVPDLLSQEEIEAFLAREKEQPASQPQPLQFHRANPHWAQLAQHPRIASIVQQLLQGPGHIVQTMFMAKSPDGGTGVALHQDTHYIRNEPNTLMACWLALSDTDKNNGGLCVLPGSHKMGLLPFEKVSQTEEHTAWEKLYPMRGPDGKTWDEPMHSFDVVGINKEDLVYLEVPRGSGVFFTSMTVHGSFANRSGDKPRLAFATHYIKDGTWIYRTDLQDPVDLT